MAANHDIITHNNSNSSHIKLTFYRPFHHAQPVGLKGAAQKKMPHSAVDWPLIPRLEHVLPLKKFGKTKSNNTARRVIHTSHIAAPIIDRKSLSTIGEACRVKRKN